MQKIDLDDGELSLLIRTFIEESNSRQTVIHDINDNLNPIND